MSHHSHGQHGHSSLNVFENLLLQHHYLPQKWLLLDSCSTTNLSNPDLLHDNNVTDDPTWVRCNAGCVKLTHQRYVHGDYPYPNLVQEPQGRCQQWILDEAKQSKFIGETCLRSTSSQAITGSTDMTCPPPIPFDTRGQCCLLLRTTRLTTVNAPLTYHDGLTTKNYRGRHPTTAPM